jgi:hypothetical protein
MADRGVWFLTDVFTRNTTVARDAQALRAARDTGLREILNKIDSEYAKATSNNH